MSTLESLIRIDRWHLDECRRHVGELEGLAEKLRQEIARLAEEQRKEQDVASTSREASQAHPGYVRQALERQRTLGRSLAEVEGQVLRARDALSETFQELKRHEIAAANRERQKRQRLARRERIELDAAAVETFRRRAGLAGG